MILDAMLDQVLQTNSPFKGFDIDFVAIAEKLPKLLISNPDAPAACANPKSSSNSN